MIILLIVSRVSLPSNDLITRTPWLSYTGGVFGLIYLVILIVLIPFFGSGTIFALLVTGQMIASIIFDHYGFFGITPHHVDASRIIGAILLIAGVYLIRR